MGGLHVASGWLTSILLALVVISSECFPRILLAFLLFAIASGWLTSILLAFFCYSQCVVCTDPLTLCVLAVGALHGSICFRLVLLVLFVLPVGGLGVASGGGGEGLTQFLLLLLSFLFFPFSTARLGSACLAASRTQGLCAFL